MRSPQDPGQRPRRRARSRGKWYCGWRGRAFRGQCSRSLQTTASTHLNFGTPRGRRSCSSAVPRLHTWRHRSCPILCPDL